MTASRRIETEADLAEGVAHLIRVEPRFEAIHALAGPPPLRRREGGFAPLLMVLIEQQVSVASGRAIWARVEAAGCVTPEAVLARDQTGLCALGLSRPKARYALALAEAVRTGALDLNWLSTAEDREALSTLQRVTGIGPWTAQIYLMFSEGRPDLCPAGDIALQEAMRVMMGLEARPKPDAFDAIAAPWSPWRAVAARLLWAYYRHLKGREGKA
ncbi:MAG: DNA-3-methyladenine glycosylase 2 family protein [Pseudomonadota bacterium]